MKRFSLLVSTLLLAASGPGLVRAQNVTIKVDRKPAAAVFARIMRQTDKNFIYSSGLLDGVKVSVTAKNEPLEQVLRRMFSGTGITFTIRGNNILLHRAKQPAPKHPEAKTVTVSGYIREAETQETLIGVTVRDMESGAAAATNASGFYSLNVPAGKARLQVSYMGYNTYETAELPLTRNITYNFSLAPIQELEEVTVTGSRNESLAMDAAEAGRVNLSAAAITSAPVVFGEADVIKSLQYEPGVSAGTEGMAGMYVHGGNADENLYMLDNVPLYQVNHFAGLFSAFNVEALKSVDFYKSSFPAKYDGRLSSYVDVHTKDGSLDSHHGTARLGLTSGSFNIDGPIRKGTTSYSVALRRSWYDVFTVPALAIANAVRDDGEKSKARYAFTDLNAKVTHHFSDRSRGDIMVYYGEDILEGGSIWEQKGQFHDEDTQKLRWGNILAKAGWSYMFTPNVFGEFTGAYSRFFSRMSTESEYKTFNPGEESLMSYDYSRRANRNSIDDWSVRASFGWTPGTHNVSFGADATFHSFLPQLASSKLKTLETEAFASEKKEIYRAFEANVYIGDDWRLNDRIRLNGGVHLSSFTIDSKTWFSLSPRFTFRWSVADDWSIKAGYSRTAQYVHQLTESFLSLPTDQWVPVTKGFRPQTSDKVFVSLNYRLPSTGLIFSIEGFWKWMHHLVEYRDEFYISHPGESWLDQLTSGKGTAKGLDFKVSKEFGRVTGHISYSLLWSDRTFAERNGGKTYPSRFDNRHKINVLLNWKINSKWEVNAAWTGMSGNRITLPVNVWITPALPGTNWHGGDYTPVPDKINNYRLPFYHRLDLSAIRHTKHGYWTFSLYNAYCNMNVVAVRLEEKLLSVSSTPGGTITETKPVFQKLHLIPIIPSVSYTWIF